MAAATAGQKRSIEASDTEGGALCPICSLSFPLDSITAHVNRHLDVQDEEHDEVFAQSVSADLPAPSRASAEGSAGVVVLSDGDEEEEAGGSIEDVIVCGLDGCGMEVPVSQWGDHQSHHDALLAASLQFCSDEPSGRAPSRAAPRPRSPLPAIGGFECMLGTSLSDCPTLPSVSLLPTISFPSFSPHHHMQRGMRRTLGDSQRGSSP